MLITTDVVRETSPLTPEWEALAAHTNSPPFLYPGWVTAWWRAFGAGTLELATLRVDGQLRALLPLYRPAWRSPAYKTEPLPLTARPGTLRSTANWHVPEFGLLAQDPPNARILLNAIFAGGPTVVSFACLNGERPNSAEYGRAAADAHYQVEVSQLPPTPYVLVDRSWVDYQAGVSSKMLADLRRRRRKLGHEGRVWLDIKGEPDQTERCLTEGLRLESSGWKARQGSAIASRPATRTFYAEVASWAAGKGWLRLAFLRVGHTAVAFQFGLEAGGTYYFLKGGYDPQFHQFAPGKLLAHDMLNRAFEQGLHRFDFLGGDESWKKEWTETCRERLVVHAFAPSILGRLERVGLVWGRPLRARVKATLRPLRPIRSAITSRR